MAKKDYIIKYPEPGNTMPVAIGTVVPDGSRKALDYLDNVRDFNQTGMDDIHKVIKLCRKLYYYGDILSTAVDILVDFPVTEFFIENVENDECNAILNHFKDNVNRANYNTSPGLFNVVSQVAHGYFLEGNAFPYEIWGETTYKPAGTREANMPLGITLLNPMNIKISKEHANFGIKRMYLKVDDNIVRTLKKPGKKTSEEQELIDMVPKELINSVKKSGFIPLDNEFVKHIARKKQDYDVWGIPYLTRVFSSAATKQKMRILDDSTIEGMLNYVIIFRIGDPDRTATLSQDRLNAFASLLRNPSSSNAMVWSYDVDFIVAGPDGKVLDMTERYKQCNYDILASLGIPEMLFTGQGSQAGVTTAVLALLKRLEVFRNSMDYYLEDMLRRICIANGFRREKPKIRWSRMDIRDDKAAKDIVLSMYDRGLIPRSVLINELGYDYACFKMLKKQEKDNKDDKLFKQPEVPFSTPGSPKNPKDGEPKSKPTSDDGRPKDKVETKSSYGDLIKHTILDDISEISELLRTKYDEEEKLEETDVIAAIGYPFIKTSNNVGRILRAILSVAREYKIIEDEDNHTAKDIEHSLDGRISDIRDKLINDVQDLRKLYKSDAGVIDSFWGSLENRVGKSVEDLGLVTKELVSFDDSIMGRMRGEDKLEQ